MPGSFAGLSNTEIKALLKQTPKPHTTQKRLLVFEVAAAIAVLAALLFGTPGSIGF